MNIVVKAVFTSIGFVILAGMLIVGCESRDTTDGPDGYSGLGLYTDNLTGCQYLSRTWSGITPRMDGHGRQVGCRDRD